MQESIPTTDAQTLCNALLERISAVFSVEFETLDIDGESLQVLGIKNMQEHLDSLIKSKKIHDPLRDLPLWAKIWPASFILGRFLRKFSPEAKSLLEIGAGMGVCGLIASRYGFSQVTLSDSEEMALNFARANIYRNNLQNKVKACHLDLRRQEDAKLAPKYDFIAASEILYLDNLHRPLLKLLEHHLATDGKAFFCTDIARLKPHFKKLAAKSFKVQEGHIGMKSQEENGEQRKIYNILILEKA